MMLDSQGGGDMVSPGVFEVAFVGAAGLGAFNGGDLNTPRFFWRKMAPFRSGSSRIVAI
jgi:hypothetical protein